MEGKNERQRQEQDRRLMRTSPGGFRKRTSGPNDHGVTSSVRSDSTNQAYGRRLG